MTMFKKNYNSRLRADQSGASHLLLFFLLALVLLGAIGYSYNRAAKNSKAATTVDQTTFKIRSWNIYEKNVSTFKSSVKTVAGASDIMGMQEVHKVSHHSTIKSKLTCDSCSYKGVFLGKSEDAVTSTSNPIVWNKSKFTKPSGTSSGYKKVCSYTGPFKDNTSDDHFSAKYYNWVKLKNNATGGFVYVINTHTVASIESKGSPIVDNKERIACFNKHMDAMTAQIQTFKNTGSPVFVLGDMNINYRQDIVVKSPTFPVARLGALEMKAAWEISNLAGIPENMGSQSANNRIIDYIYILQNSKVAQTAADISTERYGSDHSPVTSTINLKR